MEHITVIYSRNWHPFSLLIRLFTWSRWSHCGVIMPDGTVIESVGNIGVIATPLAEFQDRHTEFHIARIPCKDRHYAFRFLRQQLGKPYDLTAVISIALRRDWQETDSWFCSELVARATGLFRHDYIKRITPECLWRISEDL